jgi:hypothetical protein
MTALLLATMLGVNCSAPATIRSADAALSKVAGAFVRSEGKPLPKLDKLESELGIQVVYCAVKRLSTDAESGPLHKRAKEWLRSRGAK